MRSVRLEVVRSPFVFLLSSSGVALAQHNIPDLTRIGFRTFRRELEQDQVESKPLLFVVVDIFRVEDFSQKK